MKIPNFRKLISSDFKEEFTELVDKIGVSLNNGFDLLSEALNKKITLVDNLACTVKDIELEVPTTTPSPGLLKTKVTIPLDVIGQVIGVTVLSANAANQNVYPSGGVYLHYQQAGKNLSITHAFGLPSGQKFSLKIVAWT